MLTVGPKCSVITDDVDVALLYDRRGQITSAERLLIGLLVVCSTSGRIVGLLSKTRTAHILTSMKVCVLYILKKPTSEVDLTGIITSGQQRDDFANG